ncbi:MAG TPA: hypothetical protein VMV69_17490 [Pirellulales bacterium]|nr:hypothetical protein [Pirellulales bacterium]
MTHAPELSGVLRRLGLGSLVAGVLGGAGCAYGYLELPDAFYPAYLTAFMFWLGISLGCLALALLHGLTGGGWGLTVRRVVEAGYQTLPILALLFAPLFFGVQRIYEWADPSVMEHDALLHLKAGYLNVDGFHTRAIVCLAVWIVVGFLLDRLSPDEHSAGDSPRGRRLQCVSGLGFIAYALTLTVAAVDWVMSLEPHWYSSMYGLIYLAGQAVSGLSLAIVVVVSLDDRGLLARRVSAQRSNDLGNLLLAFVMFWAYTAFFQYLVIWSGNLPEENIWYLHRSQGGWQVLVTALMSLHFAVPFLLLLSRRVTRHAENLRRVAILLLVMRYADLYWLVVPGFQRGGVPRFTFHWLDAAALAAIGGPWLAMFAWRLGARAKVPIYDPELQEIHHE